MRLFACHRDTATPPPRIRPSHLPQPSEETDEDIARSLSPVLHMTVDELLSLSSETLHAVRQQYVHIRSPFSPIRELPAGPRATPGSISRTSSTTTQTTPGANTRATTRATNTRTITPAYTRSTSAPLPSNQDGDSSDGDWTRRHSHGTQWSFGLDSLRRQYYPDASSDARSSWSTNASSSAPVRPISSRPHPDVPRSPTPPSSAPTLPLPPNLTIPPPPPYSPRSVPTSAVPDLAALSLADLNATLDGMMADLAAGAIPILPPTPTMPLAVRRGVAVVPLRLVMSTAAGISSPLESAPESSPLMGLPSALLFRTPASRGHARAVDTASPRVGEIGAALAANASPSPESTVPAELGSGIIATARAAAESRLAFRSRTTPSDPESLSATCHLARSRPAAHPAPWRMPCPASEDRQAKIT